MKLIKQPIFLANTDILTDGACMKNDQRIIGGSLLVKNIHLDFWGMS